MSDGRYVKQSRCCKAPLQTVGTYGDFYDVCSECGGGPWPRGVSYDHVYIPSDYEKALEARVAALEETVARLSAAAEPEPGPYDTPEYLAFVEDCAKHCRCTHTVCDGVLSSGICDEIIEEDDYDREREEEGMA